jgi:hypothetical protein
VQVRTRIEDVAEEAASARDADGSARKDVRRLQKLAAESREVRSHIDASRAQNHACLMACMCWRRQQHV